MEMRDGFTLVIPLYNKVNVFRNTLDSVLNNHGSYPFECIIVDDDSTDGCSEIGEEYCVKYPDVFTYIKRKHTEEHKTPVFARNLGIKLADTKYIGFLDCDDELCPGFIDRACTFLDEHSEYNMYACGFMANEGNGKYMYYKALDTEIRDFETYVLNGCINIHHSTHIYKTKLVKIHPFTDSIFEDMVFKLKYVYYNSPIYFDNSIVQSFIWNTPYSDSQNLWYRDAKYSGIEQLFKALKDEIPGFNYNCVSTGDNNIRLYKLN